MNTTADNLARYGTLYRNENGIEVWRLTDSNGQIIADSVESDHDARWIADRIA